MPDDVVAAVINVAAIFVSSETLAFISCTCTHFMETTTRAVAMGAYIARYRNCQGTREPRRCYKILSRKPKSTSVCASKPYSFFDTVLIVTQFPMIGVGIVRTYINALLKKPLLSSVCWG